MNYGILSTASIVERYVAGIRESKNNTVYGIASRSIESAKKEAERLGIEHYYGTYEELLEDENIDIVYIPTMNAIHMEWAKKALEHGKHVVVEKPFSLHKEEAQEVFALAKEKNLFLMEAQKSVFLPTTLKLKELLENKIVGDIKYIELKAGFPARFATEHWMNDLSLGGGALYGSATYTVEFLSFLFDHPNLVTNASFVKGPRTGDDLVNFHLSFEDILVSSTIAMHVPLKNEAVFYGTKGYIVVPNFWKSKGLDIVFPDHTEHFDFPYKSEFVYEVEHISSCIEQGLCESPVMYKERTLQTIELVEELYSIYKKKT